MYFYVVCECIFPAMWMGVVISCLRLRSNKRSQKSVDCEVEPDIVFQLIFGRLKSPRRIKFSLGLCVLSRDLSREKCDLSAVGKIYRTVTWKDFLLKWTTFQHRYMKESG